MVTLWCYRILFSPNYLPLLCLWGADLGGLKDMKKNRISHHPFRRPCSSLWKCKETSEWTRRGKGGCTGSLLLQLLLLIPVAPEETPLCSIWQDTQYFNWYWIPKTYWSSALNICYWLKWNSTQKWSWLYVPIPNFAPIKSVTSLLFLDFNIHVSMLSLDE